jgi:predicted aspartyl protease
VSLPSFLAKGLRLFLTAAVLTQLNAQEPQPKNTDSTMPFELVSDFLVVVQGQAGDLAGLRFILDTGSSHTVLDRRVADRLGLRRHPGRVITFDRYIPVEWADVPQLRVGPIHATTFPVMVVALAEHSEFARGADGILGLDLLIRATKLAIDYEKGRVSLEIDPRREDVPSAPNGFVVPVEVQGIPMRLLVDTGLRDILVYEQRIRGGLSHLRTEGEPKTAVIGHLRATQVNLPGVQILGRDTVTPVYLIDGSNPDVAAIDGYLGPASLHPKRLEFDFTSGVLRWQ